MDFAVPTGVPPSPATSRMTRVVLFGPCVHQCQYPGIGVQTSFGAVN